jgi:hypothetical protein
MTPPRPTPGQAPPPCAAAPAAGDIPAPADPLLIRLFGYWQEKRGDRSMPSRAAIDPVELRGLVLNVMLFDVVDAARRFRIRLMGQAILDFVGVNNVGKLVEETMPPAAAAQMIEILASVALTHRPRFRAGYAYWHRDKSYRRFEACFLPLSPDGETVDKILAGITFDTRATLGRAD